MSYLDRLREGRYLSPSKKGFAFEFRELSRSASKKAAIHELPQRDEAVVQDLGNAATHFAIEATFSGADCDTTADAFFDALSERGPGVLLHPRWGDIDVLPLSIAQKENFVEGMRVVVFEIDFVRTSATEYPTTSVQASATITAGLDDAQAAAEETFGAEIIPTSAMETAAAKKGIMDSLTEFKARIAGTIAENAEIAADLERQARAIEDNIDTLILDPVTLAESYLDLLRTPGRAVTSIISKLQGYGALITTLAVTAGDTLDGIGEAASRTMAFVGALLGLADSALVGTLASRTQAIQAAEAVQRSILAALEAIEAVEAASGEYVAPEAVLAQIQAIMAGAGAMLLEQSYSLAIEQRVTLESERTPFDLCFELYGELDSMDDFIEQNALTGDELLLIPRGREVVYYVG